MLLTKPKYFLKNAILTKKGNDGKYDKTIYQSQFSDI